MSPAKQASPLIAGLDQLGPHDHLCSIYDGQEEHLAVVASFIHIGLNRGEKSIYVPDGSEQIVRAALQVEGVDIERALASNALVLTTKEQVYLQDGVFDPDFVFAFWTDATSLAISQGFSALRVVGDSKWVLSRRIPDQKRWIEYESRLTRVLSEINCFALCSYDRREAPPELILDVIRSHPIVAYRSVVSGNPHHIPPAAFSGTHQAELEVEGLLNGIREHKQAETWLREANDRVAATLDSMPDRFFGLSKDWRYTYLNKHAAEQLRMLGKDPASVIGKSMWEVFPYVPNEAAIRRAMAERAEVTDELFYAPLGEWVENHMYPRDDGGLVIVQRYITERKRAEEKLRRSEGNLAEGQRISHTGSWSWTAATGALFWSVEHFRIFGLDPDKVEASTEVGFGLIHPEERTFVEDTFRSAVREKSDFDVEYRIVRPDGTVRHLFSVGHPVLNESGDVVEYVGTVLDMTDRKQGEEALRIREAELARVSRVLTMGELTTSIAHELNQSLCAIILNGNAGMRWLDADSPNLYQARKALDRIVSDGNRASDVIARVRSLLKKTGTAKERLDMNRVIQDIVALTSGDVRRNRVALRTALGVGLPPILGDRVQLQQVLLNLIINAIEAMGGLVGRPPTLVIATRADDADQVHVSIEDSGVGLETKSLEHVFDAFYTTKDHGMGVGLSISRSIIEAHGGQLWATRNEDAGATFHFTVPFYRREAA